MRRQFSMPVLLACAAGVACGSENVAGPGDFEPGSPVLTTLEVTPTAADLAAVAPGNVLQLTVAARDQRGVLMPSTGVTFLSRDPAIAEVSGSGVVTAAAPGVAVIRATLTLGGITRIADMGVTVHGDYPDMAGIYDLVGMITGSDPAWGIADGSLQTAVLTIEHSPDSSRFTGTFPRFCFTDWNGESCNQTPGVVSGVIDHRGRVVIELTFEGSQSSYLYGEGELASGQIVGTYGAGGHISGNFTADRRPE